MPFRYALLIVATFTSIILYGVALGYIAERAHEECGGISSCIDEANTK